MPILLGAIADDLTGATDLANTLARAGMRTVLAPGLPDLDIDVEGLDAVVIALKSRSIPAAAAGEMSLAALRALQSMSPRQFFFKYCSTFDSTDSGNIGPVAEALLDALDADFTVFCPSFPENGRTVYQGHLFVRDRLLSESGMENHPLNPMRDPNLVRVLQRQSIARTGLVPFAEVREGVPGIRAALDRLRRNGVRLVIVDAVDDQDILCIGEAVGDLPLVTGGSALGFGIAARFRNSGLLSEDYADHSLPIVSGPAAILSGSCSTMTNVQVGEFRKNHRVFEIDPLRIHAGEDQVKGALEWAAARLGEEPILISATAAPDKVRAATSVVGNSVGTLIEQTFARIAAGLVQMGVRRLVVAGGETSGAVIEALAVKALRIGRQIAPGVPWTVSMGAEPLALALKSGNFGSPTFFEEAFRIQP